MSSCNLTQPINGSDCIGDSRIKINQNFTNLENIVCALSANTIIPVNTSTISLNYNPATRQLVSSIIPGSVTSTELSSNSVITDKIENSAVTTKKLAFDSGAFSFRNKVINGDFKVWQRGTSFTNANGFTADRFVVTRMGNVIGTASTTNISVTQSTDTPVNSGFINSIKIQRDTGDLINTKIQLLYLFESSDIKQFENKTATISFFYKKGTTFTSSDLTSTLHTGFNVDEGIRKMHNGTWASNNTFVSSPMTAPAGVWSKHTSTVSLFNLSELGLSITFTPLFGAAGTDETLFITGVQVELGDTDTPFEFQSSYHTQALCQRYYEPVLGFYDNHTGTSDLFLKQIGTFCVPKRTSSWSATFGTSGIATLAVPSAGGIVANRTNKNFITQIQVSGFNEYSWLLYADDEIY